MTYNDIETRHRRIRAMLIDERVEVDVADELATRAAVSMTTQPQGDKMNHHIMLDDGGPEPKPMPYFKFPHIADDLTAEEGVELYNAAITSEALPERVLDALQQRILARVEENTGQRTPPKRETSPGVFFSGADADAVERGLKALAAARTKWAR